MKIKAVWELTRLEHGLMYGLAVLVGFTISSVDLNILKMILGFLTALFCQASSFALNDYFDYEVDLVNRRYDRPLVRGDLNKTQALVLAVVLAVFGFTFPLLISPIAFISALLVTIVGFAYDWKIKEFGFLGNVYIAFSMAFPFIYGGIVANSIPNQVLILSAMAFLSGLGREIMKGIEDVKGDELRDVKSVARVKGEAFAYRLSAIFIVVSMILSPIPFLCVEGYRCDFKYLIPIVIADLIFTKTTVDLLRFERDIKKLRMFTLLAMLFGLIGFMLGAF